MPAVGWVAHCSTLVHATASASSYSGGPAPTWLLAEVAACKGQPTKAANKAAAVFHYRLDQARLSLAERGRQAGGEEGEACSAAHDDCIAVSTRQTPTVLPRTSAATTSPRAGVWQAVIHTKLPCCFHMPRCLDCLLQLA